MKPMEAWRILSSRMHELATMRATIYGKGYSQEEVRAEVIAFEALRRMEEEDEKN